MKVGIVTFSSAHNYGAVLQAWSLQTYLQKLGYDVDIVNLRPIEIDNVYAMKRILKKMPQTRMGRMIYRREYRLECRRNKKKYIRFKNFEQFIKNDLHTTKMYRSVDELRNADLKYDILIAGSDQIWNSGIPKKIDSAFFLDFGGEKVKRISYAASIGAARIPEDEFELFRHHLKRFDYISVREENAKASVEKLTDKPVDLVADPTFLLEQADFDRLKEDFSVKGKYIYVHNVHLNIEDEALDAVVTQLAQQTGLPVVTNREDSNYPNEIKKKFMSGKPSEFLGVIANAEYVVTNSFHATVFAITYHRKFITVPHFSNPDRMIYLLQQLGLSNHLIDSASKVPADLSTLDADYAAVEDKKAVMRQNAQSFLDKALNGPKTCESSDFEDNYEKYLITARKTHVYRDDRLMDVLAPIFEKTIQSGGKCALPIYGNDGQIAYQLTDEENQIKRAMVPEFFESEENEIYSKVKELLESNKPAVFVGNAYRIASLAKYVDLNDSNLLTIEIVNSVFAKRDVLYYAIKATEEKYREKVVLVEFTNQFKNDGNLYLIYHFESGVVHVSNLKKSSLMKEAQRVTNHVNSDYIRKKPDLVLGRTCDFEVNGVSPEVEGCVIEFVSEKGNEYLADLQKRYKITKDYENLQDFVAKEFHFDQEAKEV